MAWPAWPSVRGRMQCIYVDPILGAPYPYDLLAGSAEGLAKENQLRGLYHYERPLSTDHSSNIRHGIVYESPAEAQSRGVTNSKLGASASPRDLYQQWWDAPSPGSRKQLYGEFLTANGGE